MAVNGNSGPDLNQILQQLQQSAQQGTQGKPVPLLGFLADVNVGSGLSLQGRGLNIDGMIRTPAQRPNGPIAGLLRQMGLVGPEILEGMKKVAQAGPVQQASIEDITGQSHGLGGGFASNVSDAPSDT